jgi:hypothetical protein
MEALAVNSNDQPTIIFNLVPPDKIYKYLSLGDLMNIVQQTDILVVQLRTVCGFLGKDYRDAEGDFIKEKDKKHHADIVANFLGPKDGQTLIIRYGGEKHISYQLILERLNGSEKGYIEITNDKGTRETNCSPDNDITELGQSDRFTFEYLSKYFKKRGERKKQSAET